MGANSHFDLGDWADYVRGLVSLSRRGEMDAHLGGCHRCRTTVQLFQATVEARSAIRTPAPDSVLKAAVDLFPRRNGAARGLLPRIVARLVYDSWGDPLPAGVRAAGVGSRQGVFRAGRYTVDLRLERGRDSGWQSVVGQVADETAPGAFIPPASVALRRGASDVVRAMSNDFGEFQLEYQASIGLHLSLTFADTEVIVPLTRFGSKGRIE